MDEYPVADFNSMTPPSTEAPPVGSIPPTMRPQWQKPASTSWPMVVGIICGIFGILGMLGGVCGIVGAVAQDMMMGMAGDEAEMAAMQSVTSDFMPYLVASNLVNMLVATVLAIGGFALVSRKQWSRRVLLHWSWLRMLAVVGAVVLQYQYQAAIWEEMQRAMGEDGTNAPPQTFGLMMSGVKGLGAAFTLLWGWALPIFALVWFNRKVIRDETATWP